MIELREKIARELLPSWTLNPSEEDWLPALAKADRILAIPEIAEALLLMETAKRRFGESVTQADPATAYLAGLQNAHPWANLLRPEDMPTAS